MAGGDAGVPGACCLGAAGEYARRQGAADPGFCREGAADAGRQAPVRPCAARPARPPPARVLAPVRPGDRIQRAGRQRRHLAVPRQRLAARDLLPRRRAERGPQAAPGQRRRCAAAVADGEPGPRADAEGGRAGQRGRRPQLRRAGRRDRDHDRQLLQRAQDRAHAHPGPWLCGWHAGQGPLGAGRLRRQLRALRGRPGRGLQGQHRPAPAVSDLHRSQRCDRRARRPPGRRTGRQARNAQRGHRGPGRSAVRPGRSAARAAGRAGVPLRGQAPPTAGADRGPRRRRCGRCAEDAEKRDAPDHSEDATSKKPAAAREDAPRDTTIKPRAVPHP